MTAEGDRGIHKGNGRLGNSLPTCPSQLYSEAGGTLQRPETLAEGKGVMMISPLSLSLSARTQLNECFVVLGRGAKISNGMNEVSVRIIPGVVGSGKKPMKHCGI